MDHKQKTDGKTDEMMAGAGPCTCCVYINLSSGIQTAAIFINCLTSCFIQNYFKCSGDVFVIRVAKSVI